MLGLAGEGRRVADIGSGAGFPGMVWKIARPGMEVVLFERKERLAVFLERTSRLLGLQGLEVRAEDAALSPERGAFDVVTSKAAGRLGEILPVAGALLGPGGVYITAKGGGWRPELEGARGFRLMGTASLRKGRGEAVALVRDA
jgi:16S rRNA (guanine527-N7)-methyltransferase